MCLNPLYFIVFPVIHNSLIYWTCLLNPLTWDIVPLPPCHWSCSLLTFISVLKVVIWKLLVKLQCTTVNQLIPPTKAKITECQKPWLWKHDLRKITKSEIWWQLLWQVHPAWWGSPFHLFFLVLLTHR